VVSRGGVGMILDKTRRNRRSRFTAETRIPVGKVRPRKASRAGEPATVPAIRWSVTSGGGHGSGGRVSGPDMRRRLEDQAANRRRTSLWDPRSSRGSTRAIQFCVGAASRRSGSSAELSRSGGDEETRTPDPLLAKEMLCQLSYVPIATRGWWWAFLDSNQRPLPYQGSALTS
jgi:hypothetical protein